MKNWTGEESPQASYQHCLATNSPGKTSQALTQFRMTSAASLIPSLQDLCANSTHSWLCSRMTRIFYIEAAQPRPLQDGQAEKGQEPKPSCISCASFSTACVSAYFQEGARHRWNFEQIGLGSVWGTQKELRLDGWLDTVVFGHSIVFHSSLRAYSCMANAKKCH